VSRWNFRHLSVIVQKFIVSSETEIFWKKVSKIKKNIFVSSAKYSQKFKFDFKNLFLFNFQFQFQIQIWFFFWNFQFSISDTFFVFAENESVFADNFYIFAESVSVLLRTSQCMLCYTISSQKKKVSNYFQLVEKKFSDGSV
jgi:hypothetical protein